MISAFVAREGSFRSLAVIFNIADAGGDCFKEGLLEKMRTAMGR